MRVIHDIVRYNSVPGERDDLVGFNDKTYNGFYVSYNPSARDYGCETTALVLGQMEKFYILKGDHREQYMKLMDQGFDKCLEYYKDNIADSHEHSDAL